MSVLLGLVALSVPVLWAALHRSARFREWFVPDMEWPAFQALLLPDLGLALFTAAAAVVVRVGHRPLGLLACAAGGWGYATLYTLSWTSRTAAPWLGLFVVSVGFVVVVVCCRAVVSMRETSTRVRETS